MNDDNNSRIDKLQQWKIEILDTKSESFCGAKWYNSSMWLYNGITASCHHNPGHEIDVEAIKLNPRALHNTPQKKEERQMMKDGKKPMNCQFCWVMEEQNSEFVSDRVWTSRGATDAQLQEAFVSDYDADFDVTYLEVGFDKTCNLSCSYCGPGVSTAWVRDIKRHGEYEDIPTDNRGLYKNNQCVATDETPYVDAFIKWWESGLHKTIQTLRITGGEPLLSKHIWRFMEWLVENRETHPTTCTLHMTTNLIYAPDVLDKFLDMCGKTGMTVELYSSTEAIGDKAEYIRDGFIWNTWETNFKTVMSSPYISRSGICTTPAAQTISGFVEFLEWAADIKKSDPESVRISVNPLRFPVFQSVLILPLALRQQYRDDILDIIQRSSESWTFFEIDSLNRFATYLVEVSSPVHRDLITHDTTEYADVAIDYVPDALALDLKSFFTQYDKRRGKNFAETFPDLAEWYNAL